jgi:4-hydroxy-4-methyl-2-oxoglutarate aldolase
VESQRPTHGGSPTHEIQPFDLEAVARVVYSAVVSDSCDRHGLRSQVMSAGLKAVSSTKPTVVGWARTVRSQAVARAPERPYGTEVDFIDSLEPGQVVVAKTERAQSGFWGELFSTAAKAVGVRGAVIDGYVRDQLKITSVGFPVFAIGSHPADSLGRMSVTEQDSQIRVRGVDVNTGDLVVADIDGVVIVPREMAPSILAYAIEKATVEDSARRFLRDGRTLAEVWELHRVL